MDVQHSEKSYYIKCILTCDKGQQQILTFMKLAAVKS